MTDKLPPQLLSLFAPRPPLRYLLPADTAPEKRKTPQVSGIAKYLDEFLDHDKDYTPTDTEDQRKEKRRLAKLERNKKFLRDGLENCTFLICVTNSRQSDDRSTGKRRSILHALCESFIV